MCVKYIILKTYFLQDNKTPEAKRACEGWKRADNEILLQQAEAAQERRNGPKPEMGYRRGNHFTRIKPGKDTMTGSVRPRQIPRLYVGLLTNIFIQHVVCLKVKRVPD